MLYTKGVLHKSNSPKLTFPFLLQPKLLEELYNSQDKVDAKLDASQAKSPDLPKKEYLNNESQFRFDFNEDQMAVEKLREGISGFAAAAEQLKDIIKEKLGVAK